MENSCLRTILHLDMNSYFATCEQQANPYLRDKPVGIIKGLGRGCVIAASIEAKKFGVKTGVTVWEAKKLCPQIVLVPSDMDKYFSLTKRLMAIMQTYSPTVEIFSIDELFMDITDVQNLYAGGAWELALQLKKEVHDNLGEWMRASVGISFSKILAKLASEMHKPNGLTFLTPENYLLATENLPVEEVCGIGYGRTRQLHDLGIYTLGQARQKELPKVLADLVWLRIDEALSTIEDLEPAKSVSRTFTTFKSANSSFEILKLTRNLIEEATAKLRDMNMVGRTFCLSLDSFWTRKTINSPTDDPLIIYNLLAREYEKNPITGIRKAGVWISNLMTNYQLSMISNRDNLLHATDAVNEKFGLFTVYPASLMGNVLIRPEVTGYLGDKWYHFATGNEILRSKLGGVN